MSTTWSVGLSYELDPPNDGRTICQYMSDTVNSGGDERVGMRAYMEWVFRHYYTGILSLWALAQQVPHVGERIRTVCYKDLSSSERYHDTVNGALDFLFNGTTKHRPWRGAPPSGTSKAAAHATSHNLTIHARLLEAIRWLDDEHYDGDIAWLDSVLPC